MRAVLLPLLGVLTAAGVARAQASVAPAAQTGDVAQGPLLPTVWENPINPGQSRVYAVDGQGNLLQYLLDGSTHASAPFGARDLAVTYRVPIGSTVQDVLVAGSSANTLTFFIIDPTTGTLNFASPDIPVLTAGSATLDRVAVYHSPVSQQFYVFVADESGHVEQWQFFDDGSGALTASQVTGFSLSLGERLGGWAVDEAGQRVYATGRTTGLYRFGAEAGGEGVTLVESSQSAHLAAPLGGVALYRAHGAGYLLVANTGGSDLAVFTRGAESLNDFVVRLQVAAGNGLDGVQNPVGLAVMSFALGDAFPQGLLVAHDANSAGGQEDLKYVSWGSAASAAGLSTPDVTDDPHGADGGPDGGIADGGTTPSSRSSGCSAAPSPLGGLGFLALLFLAVRRRGGARRAVV